MATKQPERTQTDDSLCSERAKTDAELERKRAVIEEDSDAVRSPWAHSRGALRPSTYLPTKLTTSNAIDQTKPRAPTQTIIQPELRISFRTSNGSLTPSPYLEYGQVRPSRWPKKKASGHSIVVHPAMQALTPNINNLSHSATLEEYTTTNTANKPSDIQNFTGLRTGIVPPVIARSRDVQLRIVRVPSEVRAMAVHRIGPIDSELRRSESELDRSRARWKQ
jgi:hypothetical protein